MNKLLARAAFTILPLVAGAAPATVITFTGQTAATASYSESGFVFTAKGYDGATNTFSTPASVAFGVTGANSYIALPGASFIDVKAADGGQFTLGTFRYGNLVIDNGAGGVHIYGYLNGKLVLDSGVNAYASPVQARDLNVGTLLLNELQFSQQGFSAGGAALDDVNLSELSTAPELASWAMMALGFAVVGAALRGPRPAVTFG